MTVRLVASAVIAALLVTGAAMAVANLEASAAKAMTATQIQSTTPKEEAVNTALADAGLTDREITELRVEADGGRQGIRWEVDFRCGDYEYEYKISGKTGEILKQEKEFDPVPQASATIGKQAAMDAALAHAGLTQDQVQKLRCELDEDDRIWEYEVEFEFNGLEYEYEILAENGEIRKFHKEPID